MANAERSTLDAMRKGFLCRCPKCGDGKLFQAFLKPVSACERCGENMEGQRSDDLPPYITIFIVGHLIVPMVLANEMSSNPWPLWLHASVWIPLTLIVTILLMPRVKGAVIGMQWAMRLHGFDANGDFHAKPLPPSARAPR